MAGERIKLTVKEREDRAALPMPGACASEGFIPGVLYGKGKSSYAICVARARSPRRVLTGAGGLHAILDVVLEGQTTTHASILKDYQQDPIRGHSRTSISRRCGSTSRSRRASPSS